MIRSELDVLLDRVQDEALCADLRTQIERLQQRRSFGLVFEQHIPERVRLPQHPIRVGSFVVSRDLDDSPTWEVLAIEDGHATLSLILGIDGAYAPLPEHSALGEERMDLGSLVVITDFGEPVLPGFRHVGSIERGDSVAQPRLLVRILDALGYSAEGELGASRAGDEEIETLVAVVRPFLATLDDEHRAVVMPKLIEALVREMRNQIASELRDRK